MKTIKTLVIATLAVTTMSNAWSASKITEDEINAQTKITKGHIDNLIERVSRNTVDQAFRADDYLNQTQEFKNKVETTLSIFENSLEKDILPKASALMDQYNSIYNSQVYSMEQKRILTAERYENMKTLFANFSIDYKEALKKVYGLIPVYGTNPVFVIDQPKRKGSNSRDSKEVFKISYIANGKAVVSNSFALVIKKEKWNSESTSVFYLDTDGSLRQPQYYNGVIKNYKQNVDSFDIDVSDLFSNIDSWLLLSLRTTLKEDVYKKYFYTEVKGSCKSQICVGLRAGDYSSLLKMISQLLDRDIIFKLADGKEIYLDNLDQKIEYGITQLSRTDYPEKLPFEI